MTDQLEQQALQQIRLDASRDGVTLFRNNSGVMFPRGGGRPVRYGLGNESAKFNRKIKTSDLIGIEPGTGRFLAIEVKRPGWTWRGDEHEIAQLNFGLHVLRMGGLFCFASSWPEVCWRLWPQGFQTSKR